MVAVAEAVAARLAGSLLLGMIPEATLPAGATVTVGASRGGEQVVVPDTGTGILVVLSSCADVFSFRKNLRLWKTFTYIAALFFPVPGVRKLPCRCRQQAVCLSYSAHLVRVCSTFDQDFHGVCTARNNGEM